MISTHTLAGGSAQASISKHCATHAGATLSASEHLGRARTPGRRKLTPPPSVLDLRLDAERHQKAADAMTCNQPPIFTTAMVGSMSHTEIAKLLNDCWYDLVRTERRLLLDPGYDEFRRQARL
jgi:hypothetical protein